MDNFNLSTLVKTEDGFKAKQKAMALLVEKWEQTGLMTGLETINQKNSVALLLENQGRQLIKEVSQTGTSANAEQWNGIALPLVRRIFGEISAKEFVSVQPMSLPSGLVFFLDFKYATGQPGFSTTAGASNQGNSIYGITNQEGDPSQGLYGAGRFGYTINEISQSVRTTTSSLSAIQYHYDSEFSGTYATGLSGTKNVFAVLVPTTSLSGGFDTNGVRAFSISSPTASAIVSYFPNFTAISGSNLLFAISGSVWDAATPYTVKYHLQPTDTSRGDFEDGSSVHQSGTTLDIPELNMNFRSEGIIAKSRKLKATWTPEFQQDINAYQSMDAEAEISAVMSEYVSMEIDLEILDMLLQNALTTTAWSARLGIDFDSVNKTWVAVSSAAKYTQQEWFNTLGTKMQAVSNTIHTKTMRGGANFAIVGPKIATIIESMNGFKPATDGTKKKFAMGTETTGTAGNGNWTIYKNPYMQENAILMGYKGNAYLESGAAYCPYIPLISTPVVLDPDDFTPRKGIMTRYAKKMLRPEFYGIIYVEGLQTIQ